MKYYSFDKEQQQIIDNYDFFKRGSLVESIQNLPEDLLKTMPEDALKFTHCIGFNKQIKLEDNTKTTVCSGITLINLNDWLQAINEHNQYDKFVKELITDKITYSINNTIRNNNETDINYPQSANDFINGLQRASKYSKEDYNQVNDLLSNIYYPQLSKVGVNKTMAKLCFENDTVAKTYKLNDKINNLLATLQEKIPNNTYLEYVINTREQETPQTEQSLENIDFGSLI